MEEHKEFLGVLLCYTLIVLARKLSKKFDSWLSRTIKVKQTKRLLNWKGSRLKMDEHKEFFGVLAQKGFPFVAKTLIDCMAKKDDPEAAKSFHKILAMCEENDFYVDEVSAEMVTDLSQITERANVVPRYTVMRTSDQIEFGFTLIYEYTGVKGKAEIKYFFVKPEYRRLGFAKEYIQRIMPRYKSIYTDTSSENYVKLITGLGFTKVGKCKKTDDICYKWEKVKKKGKGKRRK